MSRSATEIQEEIAMISGKMGEPTSVLLLDPTDARAANRLRQLSAQAAALREELLAAQAAELAAMATVQMQALVSTQIGALTATDIPALQG